MLLSSVWTIACLLYDSLLPSGFHLGIPHDVTKIQTTKLSILLRFYFYDVLEQLKTNFHTVFASKGFLVLC